LSSIVPETDFVTVARIVSAQGRRGEVAAEILTDFPERFQAGGEFWLTAAGSLPRSFTLEQSWFHKGRVILKFRGVDTISDAELLTGSLVQVPRSERHALPSGTVYISDLVGCSVLDGARLLGKVTGCEETGAVPLLRVESQEGEILIPFAQEICGAVDLERKEIRVRLPEGLAELNRNGALQTERKPVGSPRRRKKPRQRR